MNGIATACTWIEGSADDSFDRVMTDYMIRYVPDLDRCFTEVQMPPGRMTRRPAAGTSTARARST
ncbi:hypothetical protein ACFY15_30680 [Streptomyces sp. NPDC001373]|uniref:hypothetical protein n=1 Tax=Streptomyces sp. NPDC001373 TaxID=3364565 RepID=UPI00369425A9